MRDAILKAFDQSAGAVHLTMNNEIPELSLAAPKP